MAEHVRTKTGRGAASQPGNRFEAVHAVPDWEQLADPAEAEPRKLATVLLPDASKTVITSNDSPDIPFRYSINPYRGCEHGCAYCYARPGHEFLGLSAGLDFESRILVKYEAPALLRRELNRPGWRGETLMLSGVTDCYQPTERKLALTRGLLEVMHEARQPAAIITKNALVLRDLDLLAPMAAERRAGVGVSITTLDAELARTLEPRTSPPARRLEAIRRLSAAGVPVRVMTAPIIPGLNDHEIPNILEAARDAGAVSAGYVMLRLPLAVEPIFREWLRLHRPEAVERVEARIRRVRGGGLSDSRFGQRMRGEGPYAEGIKQTFDVWCKKFGLNEPQPPLDSSQFRPPRLPGGQMRLF